MYPIFLIIEYERYNINQRILVAFAFVI
jgi:hypothetical protein